MVVVPIVEVVVMVVEWVVVMDKVSWPPARGSR
jgi:hypothetical protein